MNNKTKRQMWSKKEVELVTKLYVEDGLCVSELYPLFNLQFPERTETSVKVKIFNKLKLKHSKEQITAMKKRILSGENNPMYGRDGVFKGETKETNDIIKQRGEKISINRLEQFENGTLVKPVGILNPMYGRNSWCTGLTKYTDHRLFKAGQKISILKKALWKSYTQERKDQIISHLTLACLKARKDTKIEIIIKDILDNNNINYIKNHRISCYVLDFYLPDHNLVIECQGDYWHGNKKYFKKLNQIQKNNKLRDKKKRIFLINNDFKFLFFWENFIHKNKINLHSIISKYLCDSQNKIIQ